MKLLAAPLCLLAAVLAAVLGSPAAFAQDVVDAGPPDPCTPACDGTTLDFCDDGEATSLDCALVGERCGLVSAEWGFDCLLGEGAACDPDFAGGVSRCDREASLYCVDGTCTVAAGPPPAAAPLEPTAGTVSTLDTTPTSSNAFGCSGCGGDTSGAALGGGLLLLLRRRRRG